MPRSYGENPSDPLENLILTPNLFFEARQVPEVDWRVDYFVARKFANAFIDSLRRPGRNLYLVDTAYFGPKHPVHNNPLHWKGWYFESDGKQSFTGQSFTEIAFDSRLFRRKITGVEPFEFTRSHGDLGSWLEEKMYRSGNAGLIIQNLAATKRYFDLVRQDEDDARRFQEGSGNGIEMVVMTMDMGPDHPKIKWLKERVEYYAREKPIALALHDATQKARLEASQQSMAAFRRYSWDEIEIALAQSYPKIVADARLEFELSSPSFPGSPFWGNDVEFNLHERARLSLSKAKLTKDRSLVLSFLCNATAGEETQWFNPQWVMDSLIPSIQKNAELVHLLEGLDLNENEQKFLILYSLLRGMLKVFDEETSQKTIPSIANFNRNLLRAVPLSRPNLPDSYTYELEEQPPLRARTWFLDGFEILMNQSHITAKDEEIQKLRCDGAL